MSGPVDPSSPQQVMCPNCKGGNPPIARLCMWCGAALMPAVFPPPPRREPTNQFGPSPQPPPGFSAQGVPPRPTRKMPVLFIALGALVLLSLCALFATLGRNGTTSQRTPNQYRLPPRPPGLPPTSTTRLVRRLSQRWLRPQLRLSQRSIR